jgi:hypothetical protein
MSFGMKKERVDSGAQKKSMVVSEGSRLKNSAFESAMARHSTIKKWVHLKKSCTGFPTR